MIDRSSPTSAEALALFALRGPPQPGLDRLKRPVIEHRDSFEVGLQSGAYPGRPGELRIWLGIVCRDAVSVFGSETLRRLEIVQRVCGTQSGRVNGDALAYLHEKSMGWLNAGNLVHFALKIGQIEQIVGEDGERRWRLLLREPIYVIEGQPARAVQARGLLPAEQARRHALERRRAVRDLKAAMKGADVAVASAIGSLLFYDPNACVTPHSVYIGDLPEALMGEPIAAARPALQSWHRYREPDIETLTRWTEHWQHLAGRARETCAARRAEVAKATGQP